MNLLSPYQKYTYFQKFLNTKNSKKDTKIDNYFIYEVNLHYISLSKCNWSFNIPFRKINFLPYLNT